MYKHIHERSPYKLSYVSNRSLLSIKLKAKYMVCVVTILFYVLHKIQPTEAAYVSSICHDAIFHNLKSFLQVQSCLVAMLVLTVIGNYNSVSIVTGYKIDE
jgi:alpha-N-acetylglucosamine transferase